MNGGKRFFWTVRLPEILTWMIVSGIIIFLLVSIRFWPYREDVTSIEERGNDCIIIRQDKIISPIRYTHHLKPGDVPAMHEVYDKRYLLYYGKSPWRQCYSLYQHSAMLEVDVDTSSENELKGYLEDGWVIKIKEVSKTSLYRISKFTPILKGLQENFVFSWQIQKVRWNFEKKEWEKVS